MRAGRENYSSGSLENRPHCISIRFTQLGEPEDLDEQFSLYTELASVAQTVSLHDLSAVKAWVSAAEDFDHPTKLLACETALRLLVKHFAALPSLPQYLTDLKVLSSSLAVDAFSACLRNHSLTTAVELLEQGPGCLWSQLTYLRSPLDDVIASGSEGKMLAEEFMRLTSSIRNALDSSGTDQYDRVCGLNLELQTIVSNIRKLPGHSRFLLPSLFSNLQRAATGGPVTIVNTSKYSCDALVILVDRGPIHIPLSATEEDVRDLSKLRTLIVRAKRSDVTRDLGLFLRELWDQVVSPIADFLLTTCPCQSRIWWYPTAEVSLLPLHAAGPYRKGQQNLSALYTSPYTPTLSALIRARQHYPPNSATEQKRFLCIGQAKGTGESELLSVSTELANIGQRVDGLALFTRIEGEESCILRVMKQLSNGCTLPVMVSRTGNDHSSLRSLCTTDILQSNTSSDAICRIPNLHTCPRVIRLGDEESPDEVVHLASAI